MQKFTITSSKGVLVLSDTNSSSVNDSYIPLSIGAVDVNSNAIMHNTVQCIDTPGQITVKSKMSPKIISMDIYYNGSYKLPDGTLKSGGIKKLYEYRRLLITHMPYNEQLNITYQNGNGVWEIRARLVEVPVFEQSGWHGKAKIYFIADYPYWCKISTGKLFAAISSTPVVISVQTEGDIDSPVQATISCVTPPDGTSSGGAFFELRQTTGSNARMSFGKKLLAGEQLLINTGLNNEVYVKLQKTDGTIELANNYVVYRSSDLLVNNVGETKWRFSVFGSGGEMTVQFQYANLYLGV